MNENTRLIKHPIPTPFIQPSDQNTQLQKENEALYLENTALREEMFRMQKEHESLKAQYYYKASSLEGKLQTHVEHSVQLRAKINRIRAVLVVLAEMVGEKIQDDTVDEMVILEGLCRGMKKQYKTNL